MSSVLSKHQCCSSALRRQPPPSPPTPANASLCFLSSPQRHQSNTRLQTENKGSRFCRRADGKRDETWWRRRGFVSSQAGVLIWDYYGTSGGVKPIEIKAGEGVLAHACTFTPSLKKKKKDGQKCSWMEFMNSQSHAALQRPFLWRQGHQTSARSCGVFFPLQKYLLCSKTGGKKI